MKIKRLEIKGYQVVREVGLDDMGDFVVIAGPNGVGKTKVKDAICFLSSNNGNPPEGCSVELEATNEEEKNNWGAESVSLPNSGFLNLFSRSRKKLKITSKLIQIDSTRQIENVQLQSYQYNQIGNPKDEEVGNDYTNQRVKDRFVDVCNTIYRQKLKLLTDLGLNAYKNGSVTFDNSNDETNKFDDVFSQLLYPKRMAPVEADATTLYYFDDEGTQRPFSSLSSGEREVIVLAFDILSQDPNDCIVLIDEPEMHLHPELTFRLVKVLKSIGERNQYFLFTHSTDIISQSFETGVYFIRPKNKITQGNQAIKIDYSNLNDLTQIPNLRETVGMLSLGKKLLFVEGVDTGIDRNVFATLAKSSKVDLAIVPSDSCDNINNIGKICDTLNKGIFGIDLYMVRDRDSLTGDEVDIYTKKSGGKMIFLPFYHIENVFLDPDAIASVATQFGVNKFNSDIIAEKLMEFAKNQITKDVIRYVVNEIRFKAGNFDTKPESVIPNNASIEDITTAINNEKDNKIANYVSSFSDSFIKERVSYWKEKLENSLVEGWSDDAKELFFGKSILHQIQQTIFSNKKIILWEQIVNSTDAVCIKSVEPLADILRKLE